MILLHTPYFGLLYANKVMIKIILSSFLVKIRPKLFSRYRPTGIPRAQGRTRDHDRKNTASGHHTTCDGSI